MRERWDFRDGFEEGLNSFCGQAWEDCGTGTESVHSGVVGGGEDEGGEGEGGGGGTGGSEGGEPAAVGGGAEGYVALVVSREIGVSGGSGRVKAVGDDYFVRDNRQEFLG